MKIGHKINFQIHTPWFCLCWGIWSECSAARPRTWASSLSARRPSPSSQLHATQSLSIPSSKAWFPENIKAHWYHLVLVTFRPYVLSQKVMRVEYCFGIVFKLSPWLALFKECWSSALLSTRFEIWHEDEMSQGPRDTIASFDQIF